MGRRKEVVLDTLVSNGKEKLKLFGQAEPKQAYLKAGIMGFQGAGKTTTAVLIAKGMWEHFQLKKPVFFLDTELGSDWFIDDFKKWGIPFEIERRTNFSILTDVIDYAEKNGSFLIIDSITHYWNDFQESFKRANDKKRISLYDWQYLKPIWKDRFVDRFIFSKAHIILCGRAMDKTETQINSDGVENIVTIDTKMRAQNELGFEPNLLLEMQQDLRTQVAGKKQKIYDHLCFVRKDRSRKIHGEVFRWKPEEVEEDPMIVFNDFLPHILGLNIGGDHIEQSQEISDEIFQNSEEYISYKRKKEVEILLEKIKGDMTINVKDTKERLRLLKEFFGTTSWTEVETMKLETLQECYNKMANTLELKKGE